MKYTLIIAAVLFSVTAGTAAGIFITYTRGSAVSDDAQLYIPTGATFEQQADSLESSGVIRNIRRYKRFAKAKDLDEKVFPGHYALKKGMTYQELVLMIGYGKQTPVNLTFNSYIRTRERLAGVVSRYIEADSLSVLNMLNDDSVAAGYGFKHETFMGMFVPNTYEFYWNTDAKGFMDRMRKEFDRFWNTERMDKLSGTGLTRDQAIALASIVTEETLKSDEMSRMAGVYLNRLRIGMPLQADPTVKFALGDFTLRRILYRHLEVDSPYNTYKNKGLPPGLICIPSVKAIDAVLDSEKHNYLFFCAKEDFSGYHNFAATYAEHQKNARAYSNALNQRGIK